VGASFGYVLGFIAAAVLCGYLAGRGADRSVLRSVPVMIAGEVVIYAFGVTWLALSLHLSASAAISEGFTPFVAGDAIKAAIAAGLLPAAWWLTGYRRGRTPGEAGRVSRAGEAGRASQDGRASRGSGVSGEDA
jgi:biotin transport system substrate-specific component